MILITGATGNIGSQLVPQLLAKDASLRVITRDEAKVAHLNPAVERVIGDRQDAAIVRKALPGVRQLFLLPALFDPDHTADRLIIEEAKRAGVQRIVMISSAVIRSDSENQIARSHREIEVLVEESGIPGTFLRPGGFMSNAVLWWAENIKSQGKVFNPSGDGKSAPISPYDIAAVAAVALTTSGHEGKTYYLTGPELLSTHDQVRLLSKAIGKPVECIDIPVEVAAARMKSAGVPEALIEALSRLWIQLRNGQDYLQNDEVERLTGRPGQTFETWCYEHRSAFV
jgi:(4-alkanoyl-5-oxo-2,5-dihydrofuran-3-yl)methyl phosphate reductase